MFEVLDLTLFLFGGGSRAPVFWGLRLLESVQALSLEHPWNIPILFRAANFTELVSKSGKLRTELPYSGPELHCLGAAKISPKKPERARWEHRGLLGRPTKAFTTKTWCLCIHENFKRSQIAKKVKSSECTGLPESGSGNFSG